MCIFSVAISAGSDLVPVFRVSFGVRLLYHRLPLTGHILKQPHHPVLLQTLALDRQIAGLSPASASYVQC